MGLSWSSILSPVWPLPVIGLVALVTSCSPATHAPPQAGGGPSVAARPPLPGAPAGVTAFVDVAVIPMDIERVLPNRTVLVQRGRIAALGPVDQVRVPAGAARIDGRGKYLIPGLGDCHAHISAMRLGEGADGVSDRAGEAERRLFRWLAGGVTTVRNMDYMDKGNSWLLDGRDLLRLKARAAAGELWSPRIYTAGQWAPRHYTNFDRLFGKLNGTPVPASGAPRPRMDSVAAYVAAYKVAGYDFLKIHEETPEVFDSVLAAAHRVGIPVVGHVPSGVPLERALAAGMRSIEHLMGYPWGDAAVSDSAIQALAAATKRAGVWQCVTANLFPSRNSVVRSSLPWPWPKIVKAFHGEGVGILLGADQPAAGGDVHRELERLVTVVGLTPYQALVTGTTNMAAYLGTPDETGTIATGKRADLVLLSGNPLEDIRHTKQPAGVMLGGRWLPRAEIDRRLAALAVSAEP